MKIPRCHLIAALLFPSILSAAETIAPRPAPTIKRPKASVTTPLFIRKETGVNAITQVTLSANAVPTKAGTPGIVTFVPPLGPAGKAVLDSVSRYLVERHGGWPAGHRIELTFSVPVAPDDTAAAGLAAATVLDSIIAGWECDAASEVVGHLQADGKIVSVSGALPRLLTAMHGGCSRILLPEKNVAEAAADVMVNEGPANFGRVQMFAVKDFDEIPMMAGKKLEPLVAESINAFNETQKSLLAAGTNAANSLKDSEMQESLRTVLEKWPNHVTARLLLGYSIGRYQTFSPAGSAQVIDLTAATLMGNVNAAQPHEVRNLPPERIEADLAALAKYAARVDPKARSLVDHLVAYGKAAQSWHKTPPRTQADGTALATKLSTEAALARDERQKLARLALK